MHNNKHQRISPTGCRRFWIIGAGRFGKIAATRISRHIPGATITVVDRKPFIMASEGITTIVAEGIQWLKAMLDPNAAVDMIVPAIPVHVTAQWLKYSLDHRFAIHPFRIPDSLLLQMPNALRGKTGQAFVQRKSFP